MRLTSALGSASSGCACAVTVYLAAESSGAGLANDILERRPFDPFPLISPIGADGRYSPISEPTDSRYHRTMRRRSSAFIDVTFAGGMASESPEWM